MSDVFASLAEQALGHSTAIQPLVASRFGVASAVSADISLPIAEASESTAPLTFAAPPTAQVDELPEPLISADVARTAAPLPIFRQMAQAVSAIQAVSQSKAVESNAVDSTLQRLNLPREVEPPVDTLLESKIDLASQVAQLTHMSATSLPATAPLLQDWAQIANSVTPMTHSEALERSDTPALVDSESQTNTSMAGSTAVDPPAQLMAADLSVVITSAPMGRSTQTSAQRFEPAHEAVPRLTDNEPSAALLRVQKPLLPTSVDVSAIVQAKFAVQSEAPMPPGSTRAAALGSSSSEELSNAGSRQSPIPSMRVPSLGSAVETQIELAALPATETHSPHLASIVNAAKVETKQATPAARARSHASLTPKAISDAASNVIEQQITSAATASAGQPSSSPQPANSSESPPGSVTRQPPDQNPERAIAPVIVREPTIGVSQQAASQGHTETPASAAAFLVDEAQTQVAIAPINEAPRSTPHSAAHPVVQRRNDSQPFDSIPSLPIQVKYQPQDQNPERTIATAVVREPTIEVSQQAASQRHPEISTSFVAFPVDETETQVAIAPINEVPQPTTRSAAYSVVQRRSDSQSSDSIPSLPGQVKYQPQDQNPERAIALVIVREPTIGVSQQPASQYHLETPASSPVFPVGEVPRPALQLAAHLVRRRHTDNQPLSDAEATRPSPSAPIDHSSITLPLVNAARSLAIAGETGAPYPLDRSSMMSVRAEGSIRPRPDSRQAAMDALLHETTSRDRPHAAVEAPPTIRVTIGRIEVRTTPPPSTPAVRQARPAQSALSLQDYLKQSRSKKS